LELDGQHTSGFEPGDPLVLLSGQLPEQWHSYALLFSPLLYSDIAIHIVVNFGGQPYINRDGEAAPDGQQGIRLYNGCPSSGTCDIYEDSTVRSNAIMIVQN
jgi:hypothetical protein